MINLLVHFWGILIAHAYKKLLKTLVFFSDKKSNFFFLINDYFDVVFFFPYIGNFSIELSYFDLKKFSYAST